MSVSALLKAALRHYLGFPISVDPGVYQPEPSGLCDGHGSLRQHPLTCHRRRLPGDRHRHGAGGPRSGATLACGWWCGWWCLLWPFASARRSLARSPPTFGCQPLTPAALLSPDKRVLARQIEQYCHSGDINIVASQSGKQVASGANRDVPTCSIGKSPRSGSFRKRRWDLALSFAAPPSRPRPQADRPDYRAIIAKSGLATFCLSGPPGPDRDW